MINIETPFNLDAEKKTLVAIFKGMVNTGDCTEADFYDQKCKLIYRAIKNLAHLIPNLQVDEINDYVQKHNIEHDPILHVDLFDLFEREVVTDSIAKHWYGRLKEVSNLRNVARECSQIPYLIHEGKIDSSEAMKRLSDINIYSDQEEKPELVTYPSGLDETAFYGIAGEIVKAIEPHSESDPVALLMSFLTAFGNIIGNKPHFRVEADRHESRLFTVLVGKSSKGRKGTSWGYINKIFEQLDPDWCSSIKNGLSSGEGLIWAVRDPVAKHKYNKGSGKVDEIIDDPGIDDKRLLVYEGEFAQPLRVMERDGSTLSPVLRNAWDNGNLRTLTKNSPAISTNAHISIIGHITTNELLKYLKSNEQGNGFANRILWVCVKRSKTLPFGGNLDDDVLIALADRLREVIEYAQHIDEIYWSDQSRDIWEQTYPDLSRERLGITGSILGRAEAYVTRIASIYALLDKSALIEKEHILASLAIWEYVEQSVFFIFGNATGNNNADKIIQGLENAGGELTKTEILHKVFNRNLKSEKVDEALDVLLTMNKISISESKTEGRNKTIIKLQSTTYDKNDFNDLSIAK